MVTSYRRLLVAGAVMCMLAAWTILPQPARCQFTSFYAPESPKTGTLANFFVTWDGSERADGMLVELPTGWVLETASVLQDGYRSVPTEVQHVGGRRYRVLAGEPLDANAEAVLGVRVGEGYAAERFEVVPLVRSGRDFIARSTQGITRYLRAEDRVEDAANNVLSFAADEREPLVFRSDVLPDLSVQHAFTLSFWFRTTALGEILLSTWNGDDSEAYPVEIVIDRSGRLRSFRGQTGEHQSIGSKKPVADGSWHHVTVANEPATGWLRLRVDGDTVDSLFSPVPPAIRMGLPLTLGGRAPGAHPYFDGLRAYSGVVDALDVTSADESPLHVGFDEDLPDELLQRPAAGVRLEKSDLPAGRSLQDFRVEHVSGGVVLNWRSSSRDVSSFVVERSLDGRSFETVGRLMPDEGGAYSLFDGAVPDRVVYYRVRQISAAGTDRVSGTLKVGLGDEVPDAAVLYGNFPNPFNPSTTITYEVRENADIHIAVWDLAGQPVATLVDRTQGPGMYEVRFDAKDLPSGTYFVRLRTGEGVKSHKMILSR